MAVPWHFTVTTHHLSDSFYVAVVFKNYRELEPTYRVGEAEVKQRGDLAPVVRLLPINDL